jgi:hypothetical protein
VLIWPLSNYGDSWTKAPREAGKAWKEYSDAIGTIITRYHEAEAASARMLTALAAENTMRLASIKAMKDYAEARLEAEKASLPAGEYARRKGELGAAAGKAESDTKWEGEQAEWYAKNERIIALNQEAAAKEAQAKKIHVGEARDYEDVGKGYKESAELAADKLKKSREYVGDLRDYKSQEGSILTRVATATKVNYSLGRSLTTIVSNSDPAIDDVIKQEMKNQGDYQTHIAQYKHFQAAQSVREEARTRRKNLLDEAATARGAAATGVEDLGDQAGAAVAKHAGEVRNQVLESLAEAYKALAEINGKLLECNKAVADARREGHGVAASTLEDAQRLRAEIAAMKKQINAMEGRTPRI